MSKLYFKNITNKFQIPTKPDTLFSLFHNRENQPCGEGRWGGPGTEFVSAAFAGILGILKFPYFRFAFRKNQEF